MNQKRNIVFIIVAFFISFVISNYFIDKAKWLDGEHPYPKAKEALIKADTIMIPIKVLHSLPLIDEKSAILQPLLSLQDSYIKQWQENIPNDDAEKYLGWYLFRLNSLIIPNLESMALYKDGFYSFEEVRTLLDKIWLDMEMLAKYKAKDEEFEQMRYIAFMKLSFLYVRNLISYWNDENRNFNNRNFNNDFEQMENLLKLNKYINDMQNYYKKTDNKIYQVALNDRMDYARTHSLMFWILDFYNDSEKYKEFDGYCEIKKNSYLKKYLSSRAKLIDMLHNGDNSVDNTLSDYTDESLNKICPQLNLKKGVKYNEQ